jgi:hypothetical protein
MNLFIPVVGTFLTLEKDWEFTLNSNYSNYRFWEKAFPNESSNNPNPTWRTNNAFYAKPSREFGLLRGTVLKVERVTVVKRASVNAISFTVRHDARGEINKKVRFFVSIEDANKMICSVGDNSGEK